MTEFTGDDMRDGCRPDVEGLAAVYPGDDAAASVPPFAVADLFAGATRTMMKAPGSGADNASNPHGAGGVLRQRSFGRR